MPISYCEMILKHTMTMVLNKLNVKKFTEKIATCFEFNLVMMVQKIIKEITDSRPVITHSLIVIIICLKSYCLLIFLIFLQSIASSLFTKCRLLRSLSTIVVHIVLSLPLDPYHPNFPCSPDSSLTLLSTAEQQFYMPHALPPTKSIEQQCKSSVH